MNPLTPDATAALEKVGLSRRDFIKSSGALIVAFTMAPAAGAGQGSGFGLARTGVATARARMAARASRDLMS